MPGVTTTPADRSRRQVFRPSWLFVVPPVAVAAVTVAGVGWFAPAALWYVVPTFGLVLTLLAFLNTGLILSREGIEWYALRPGWRFRKVPWSAVRDVRRGFFGLGGPIRLIVEFDRYEPWAWGTPRRDRRTEIAIRPSYLAGGEGVWDAIQHWRSSSGRVVVAPERSTGTSD